MATPSIGFVGLGNMGLPMALRLLDRGRQLLVVDRDAQHVDPAVEAGAVRGDLDQLIGCEIILFACPDEQAVHGVMDVLQKRPGQGQVLVVHSTVVPQAVQDLALRAQSFGADLVDAPVSGGASRAREGDLTVMVGCTAEIRRRVDPILDDLGSRVVTVGPVGSAAAVKLANQLITFVALAGVHEAMALTRRFGLAPHVVLDVLETCTGDTWVGRHWGFYDRLVQEYDAAGTAQEQRPWHKDLRAILALERAADFPVAQAAADHISRYVDGAVVRTGGLR